MRTGLQNRTPDDLARLFVGHLRRRGYREMRPKDLDKKLIHFLRVHRCPDAHDTVLQSCLTQSLIKPQGRDCVYIDPNEITETADTGIGFALRKNK